SPHVCQSTSPTTPSPTKRSRSPSDSTSPQPTSRPTRQRGAFFSGRAPISNKHECPSAVSPAPPSSVERRSSSPSLGYSPTPPSPPGWSPPKVRSPCGTTRPRLPAPTSTASSLMSFSSVRAVLARARSSASATSVTPSPATYDWSTATSSRCTASTVLSTQQWTVRNVGGSRSTTQPPTYEAASHMSVPTPSPRTPPL